MTMQQKTDLATALGSICVFRNLLSTKPIADLIKYLSSDADASIRLSLYGEFVYSLNEDNYDFAEFLCRAVYSDENRYIINTAQNKAVSDTMKKNAVAELELLSYLTELTTDMLCGDIDFSGYIPRFDNQKVDFVKSYNERLLNINKYGYGIFSTAKMFKLENDEIIAVKSADDITKESFIGYEEERQQVFDNTKALIDGRVAANVLLFGDAGTGKSSTVKACANYFADDGVRLIEIRKDQLFSLPHIMGRIAENPLKFIVFIDDLSFNKNDDCFSMLKAALEGSASAKADNAVIYATSNRRHIVKESFSGRDETDDIHHNDTVQELLSLSDRFGLTVYFERPNKRLYLEIIHGLARKHDISIDPQELDIKAEAFALKKGSRSPRAAEQFINSLL